MTNSGSHPFGAGLDTSEGRSFVRGRLALLGSTLGVLAGIFFVTFFILNVSLGTPPLEILTRRRSIAPLAGAFVLALLWLLARRSSTSMRALGALDAGSLLLCCASWLLIISESPDSTPVALLASALTVVARAVIIPSSTRRTALVSTAGMAGVLVVSLVFVPTVITAVTVTLWIVAAVAVAAVASQVIYGLRQPGRRPIWALTSSRRRSGPAGWARSGALITGCSSVRRRSS
jgi:hypothetical protein